MLNVLNLVTSFKERLVDQRDKLLAIVEPYINSIVDGELDLDLSSDNEGFEIEISEQKYDAYLSMFNAIVNYSVPLMDGTVVGVTREIITDDTTITNVYKDALHNSQEICRVMKRREGPYLSYFILWEGWDVGHNRPFSEQLSYFYDGLLDAEAITTTVMTAIDLCAKGQLDPTNLTSAIANMGLNARQSVKETINIIVTNISGTEAYQQAYGLLNAIKDVYSGATAGNITEDEGYIDFHPVDYSVVGSILLPIDNVVSSVATMVGAIIAMFGHPIGLMLSAAASVFSGLINTAETVFGNDWNISPMESLDNEACCLPLASGAMVASDAPSKIVDYTKKYGYLRSENSLYVLYTWMGDPVPGDPPIEMLMYELFPNVNINLNYDYQGSQENSVIYDIINTVETVDAYEFILHNVGRNESKSHVTSLFANDNTPTTAQKVQFPTEDAMSYLEFQNRFISYNLILQFAFAASRYMAAYFDYNTGIVMNYAHAPTLWITGRDDKPDPSIWTVDDCFVFFASLIRWLNYQFRDGKYTDWTYLSSNSDDLGGYAYGLTNHIYKAFLRLKKLSAGNQDKFIKDIFAIFDTVIDMGDTNDSRDTLGAGKVWSCSPCLKYSNDFLVSPPKNRFNFKTRLLTTAGVLTAIAATTAITAVKMRKKIAYKSMQVQRSLQDMRDKYIASGSYEDWNNLYRATKRYNKTYGLLTGSSFDMNNAWYNDTRATGVMNSVSDVFPNLVSEDPATGAAGIDLSPVINLIK